MKAKKDDQYSSEPFSSAYFFYNQSCCVCSSCIKLIFPPINVPGAFDARFTCRRASINSNDPPKAELLLIIMLSWFIPRFLG